MNRRNFLKASLAVAPIPLLGSQKFSALSKFEHEDQSIKIYWEEGLPDPENFRMTHRVQIVYNENGREVFTSAVLDGPEMLTEQARKDATNQLLQHIENKIKGISI